MSWRGKIHTKYVVEYFTILTDQCTIGFQDHANINPLLPIDKQLNRRRLYFRTNPEAMSDHRILKKVIENNASLRINFGWSFESEYHFKKLMAECIEEIAPRFNCNVGILISDLRCDWLGFVPHNVFDKEAYVDLSTWGLILFNNEIIDFQINVVEYIIGHEIYKEHSMLRDDTYRFECFKRVRKDREALVDAYHYYMKSIKGVCAIKSIPRDYLEEQIGCHFLYNPDLFFELLEFSKLKGEIHE